MRITLLEPDFVSEVGHYASYVDAMWDACRHRGWTLRVVVDSRMPTELVERLRATGVDVAPLFGTGAVGRLRMRALTWPLGSAEVARVAVAELRRTGGPQLVVGLSGRTDYVAGLALATQLTGKPLVYQMFCWDSGEQRSTTPHLIRRYRKLTEAIVRAGGKLRLVAQSAPVARHVGTLVGATVADLPMLLDWNRYPEPVWPDVPTVAFVGDARADKGFALFVEAALTLPESVRVVAQAHCHPRLADPSILQARERLRARPNTVVIDTPLSSSDYLGLLASVDAIALPYVPEDYAHRTSNVFSEACGLGVTPIVPAGTWMSEMAATFGTGVVFRPYSAAALAAAIERCLADRAAEHRRGRAAASAFRAAHNADRVIDRLLEVAGISPDGRPARAV